MLRIVVREFDRIDRAMVGEKLSRKLQRFDETLARPRGRTIFDWGSLNTINVQNFVGVVQIPGLVIEILPKIADREETGNISEIGDPKVLAQKNLLYMLSVAGAIPYEERHLADERVHRLPLLDVLIQVFAGALLKELREGVPRDYVRREENLSFVRGKVLHAIDSRLNVAHRERMFLQYDEFLPDTPLNRIIKATCRRLKSLALDWRTRVTLNEASLGLADVEDVSVSTEMFERLIFNRNTERFRTILAFCRMVLLERTPSAGGANASTFSLLFPMEKVFENFVGELIRRHSDELALKPYRVRLQSRGKPTWLVRDAEGVGKFQLKPDILIETGTGRIRIVLDTKWKRLQSDQEDVRGAIAQADMYQLYAYAQRFDSADNVLLYPAVSGMARKVFHLEPNDSKRIRIEFINLDRDLHRNRAALLADLKQAIWGETSAAGVFA